MSDLEDLEDLITKRLAELHTLADTSVIKQRIFGQIDALDWVMQQIDELTPSPTVEPTRFDRKLTSVWDASLPPWLSSVLDGLERAGEQYHVSTDGKKVYVRKNGQWVQAMA